MWLFEKLNTPMTVAVVLVLFLVVDGFLFYRYQASIPDTDNVTATQPETVPSSLLTEETSSLLEQGEPTTASETNITEESISSPEQTTEESNELHVDVRVVGATAWLRVQEDGQIVVDQEATPGFSRRFEADQEIRIRTGNALVPAAKLGLGRLPKSRILPLIHQIA
jgi:hypothetical protein